MEIGQELHHQNNTFQSNVTEGTLKIISESDLQRRKILFLKLIVYDTFEHDKQDKNVLKSLEGEQTKT